MLVGSLMGLVSLFYFDLSFDPTTGLPLDHSGAKIEVNNFVAAA